MKNHLNKLTIIGLASITLGLIGLTPFAWQFNHTPATANPIATSQQAAVALEAPAPAAPIVGKPARIVVSDASIDLPVIDGAYSTETGEWTLTDTKAQFALPTSQPNDQAGNTLIYGHDTNRIFHQLHNLPLGSHAVVHTDNGHQLTYALRASEVVDPSNTAIFDYQGKPQLTLQTCTGAFSEARKFFYFDLIAAQ